MTLFSEAFMEFFKAVPDNNASVEEFSGYIIKAFHPVADALGIGKLEITLNSPANAYQSPIKNSTLLLYHYREGYSDNAIKDQFITGGGGEATLRTFPRNGQQWDAETVESIHLHQRMQHCLFDSYRSRRVLHQCGHWHDQESKRSLCIPNLFLAHERT